MSHLPLFGRPVAKQPVFEHLTAPISQARLLSYAQHLAAQLPAGEYVFNLCSDRLYFSVSLIAGLLAGKQMLLPVSKHVADLGETMTHFDCKVVLSDAPPTATDAICLRVDEIVNSDQRSIGQETNGLTPNIDNDVVLAVAFTSGSTGKPDPHAKLWGTLANTARCLAQRFKIGGAQTIVATVPSQHMYGLEMTTLIMLQGGARLHRGQPFFPKDVLAALTDVVEPVLVTTPVHLRALVQSDLAKPTLYKIICATAPLSEDLAAQAEREFGCPVEEIYGCTEAGSVATRRTVQGELWHLLEGFEFNTQTRPPRLCVPLLPDAVELADQIELAQGGFYLRGRNEDMLNVAGKRFSLVELNLAFQRIDQVRDAIAVVPPDARHGRPAALVVSDLSAKQVATQLARQIDAAFIPRPIVIVASIPRNAAGKVTKASVLELLNRARGK